MRALRSRTVQEESEDNERLTENSEQITEETISRKAKRKKLKKHVSDSESNEQLLEDSKHTAEENVSKKSKRKKCKKRNENTDHITEDSEHISEERVSKKSKRKKSKKYTSDSESTGQDENDKSKNIQKRTSNENYAVPQEIVKKKKSKKHKSHIEANSTVTIQTSEAVLNTSTESTKKPKKFMKNRDSKTRELRSTIFNSPFNFDKVVTSTVIKHKRPEVYLEENENDESKLKKSKSKHTSDSESNEKRTTGENYTVPQEIVKKKKSKKHKSHIEANSTVTIQTNEPVLNTSTESQQSTKKSKKFDWKPRELRSTIFNSPINFNNVVTSTVIKPKRPELEEDENDESKLKKSKSEPNGRRQSNEETFNKMVGNISQSKTKRSTLASLADPEETNKLNKSVKHQSLTVENRRDTFNKQPKKFSNDTNSVIAIFDSPEVTTIRQNTFNKSKTVEPEVTSDEEMETDDSVETSKPSETFSIFPKNKALFVQNTVITISDSPEKTTLQRNTFNKSEPQPELTSDEDETSKKLSDSSKLKPQNQSLNRTKTAESLDAFTSRRDTFCKTPKNMILRKSDTNNLPEIETDKDEGLSDVSESILEGVFDISDSPDKTKVVETKKNDTYELKIVNTSGDWKIENSGQNKKQNGTFEIENKENDSSRSKGNSTIMKETFSLSPKDKSVRKKWLKFPRHSTDAQIVLDQISSPRLKDKIVQKIMGTPTNLYNLQKPPIAPSSLSVQKSSVKKSPKSLKKSPFKSNKKLSVKKSASKRTAMPNFALIHQKAYQKMENLSEYSERKKQRAQLLLNPGSKRKSVKLNESKPEETKAKSSRQLFTNDGGTKYNRFGFKVGEQAAKKPTFNHVAKPTAQVIIAKPVVKPSVFARTEVVAIANKNKVVSNHRENRRDMLKGVRTNRRFELLMQMRNK